MTDAEQIMQVEVCLDLEDELTEESINKYCHMYWYYALVLQCKGCFYIKEQYLQALKNK